MSAIQDGASGTSALVLADVALAIGDPTRWAILAELSSGEPRMVKEIAERLERSPSLISKHLAVLQRAGMVVTGRGRLWQIPAQFIVATAPPQLDFGHCLLRVPALAPKA